MPAAVNDTQRNELPPDMEDTAQATTQAVAGPVRHCRIDDTRVTLVGTAHVSRNSAEQVETLLAEGDYDAVAVELCPSRYNAIVDPESLARMDLIKVLREGKVPMVAASLALSAFQQRMADQFGIRPGAEMHAAVDGARHAGLPVLLVDREIGVTLKRIYRNVGWWQRISLLAGLVGSVVSRQEVSEAEIERLKEGDILESTFAQFADEAQDLYVPLIEERDHYMVARMRQEVAGGDYSNILVVVGAGHLQGMQAALEQATPAADDSTGVIARLDQVPAPSRWPKLIPWAIVVLILAGFAAGFSRSSELGWQLVLDWVVINGGLAALGALLAGGHILTVAGAFLAAPLTSLNPTIGAGMVTGAIEAVLRRPRVGDFAQLRQDTAHWRGWWRNRVARTLLVFLFSTIGSAVGTYLAGFRILGRLTA